MAIRLKSLELNGYKTFASKTLFEFSGNINVIVGPNGSGKSNIADALRWVLGEQSYRLLRGRKTDDMIFSGSETRSRSGMASVTVTFDNSDGWLPIDFSEVSVTRRAYRDGKNEYLINNQRTRLKDVTELLASSGLSERTYTVIGQGLVDTALTLNSEERRRLFEEAAGIGLYRYRKQQALRRLDATKRNLERVQDILSELEPRLKSLSRQAQRTAEFDQVRSDLREVLREWYGYHWHQAQKEVRDAREVARGQEENLAKVRQNQSESESLIKINRDVIAGLRGRLNSWHRQLAQIHTEREDISRELAVSSERRRALQEEKNRLDVEGTRTEEDLNHRKTRFEEAASNAGQAAQEVESVKEEFGNVRKEYDSRLNEQGQIEISIQDFQKNIYQLTTQKAKASIQKTEYGGRIERLTTEKSRIDKLCVESEAEIQKLESSLGNSEGLYTEVEEKLLNEENSLEKIKKKIENIGKERDQIQSDHSLLAANILRHNAELDVLNQAETNLVGYATGAKILLKASKEGQLGGSKGAFVSKLKVDKEFEVAISAALGDFSDAIIFEGEVSVEEALNLLAESSSKAALLPVNILKPLAISQIQVDKNCFGIAADLVKTSAEIKPAVDLLLGQVVIVKDRRAAKRIIADQNQHIRAVTLKGEIFFSGGAILVDSEERSSVLRRPRKIQELEKKITEKEKSLAELNGKLSDINAREKLIENENLQSVNSITSIKEEAENIKEEKRRYKIEFEQTNSQFQWRQEQKEKVVQEILETQDLIEKESERVDQFGIELKQTEDSLKQKTIQLAEFPVEEYQERISSLETQLAVNERALEHAEQIKTDRNREFTEGETRVGKQNERLEELGKQIQELDQRMKKLLSSEKGIGEQIAEVQNLISPAEVDLQEGENEQESLREKESEMQKVLNIAERHFTQAQIASTKKQEDLDNLRQRIEEDFGLVEFEYQEDVSGPTPLPFGEMVERLPLIKEISDELEETLKRQRMQLRRVGAVNPDAQQEFIEVKERFEFLTNQVNDLEAAEIDLREVIAELDVLMDREFRKTFDAVAVEFKENFKRLFGGGAARLILTDLDDISETGIEIEARLPGKRLQQLALLSGGERSLTAAALIFSLIKASPTPFCVMDEVDAMLDEANVGRFREMLSEIGKETQFVVITHNRHTVQAADVIYGITMRRDTTSQSISLKLEDVDERYSS